MTFVIIYKKNGFWCEQKKIDGNPFTFDTIEEANEFINENTIMKCKILEI